MEGLFPDDNPILKWMITRGTPILRYDMFIYIYIHILIFPFMEINNCSLLENRMSIMYGDYIIYGDFLSISDISEYILLRMVDLRRWLINVSTAI